MTHRNYLRLLMALIAGTTLVSAAPLGTAFTYQGRLFDQNTLANGSYDLRVGLYDAASAGTRIGPLLTLPAVAVSNGVFTVTLDFGASAFGNTARWLELGVRPGGSTAAFALLSGRQPLTPVPQALYAPTAGTASTATTANGLAATAVVPGTVIWQSVAGTTQAALPNRGYVLTNQAEVTVNLPSAPNVGDVVRINGVGTGGWQAVASAGQSIVGTVPPPVPGETWTAMGKVFTFPSLAASADGTKLILTDGFILYLSSDSGASWNPLPSTPPAQNYFSDVASSSDGTKLFAAEPHGTIWISADSGGTWTPRQSQLSVIGLACSADGNKLVAGTLSGIQTSTDAGVTWVTHEAGRPVDDVASSADGTHLIGVTQQEGVFYTSTDSGMTWTSKTSNRPWSNVASSADGVRLLAAETGGRLYTSTDSGVTWTPRESNRDWLSVAMSSDGSKLFATVLDGPVYVSTGSVSTAATPLKGSGGSSVELQYVGNSRWQPLAASILRLNNQDLYLRAGSDSYHGLGWHGAGRPFGDETVDGPVLYGWDGGALGARDFSGSRLALRWNQFGDVFVDPSQLDRRLVFGGVDSGEAIASKRSDGGNQWGLDFFTSGTSRISITRGGNVGVGTDQPRAALHIRPTSGLIVGGDPASGGWTTMNFGLSAEREGYGILQVVRSSGSSLGNLSLNPGGGNVGIGINGPQAALHVRPASGKGDGLIVGGNASAGGYTTINLGVSTEKNGYGTIQVVKSSGSALGDLSLNPHGGDVYVARNLYVDGYLKGKFGGNYYNLDRIAGGAAIWSSSDQRLKQDITPIPDALAAIRKLRGVTYHWNEAGLNHLSKDIEKNWESASRTPEDNLKLWEEKRREADAQNSKLQTGFIAQEVEQVFPDWVKTGEDGYKQIDMSRLNAVLVNALHEQQDQIEALRKEMTDLRRLMRTSTSGVENGSENTVAEVHP